MSSRRLEDRIRELCVKLSHQHGAEFQETLAELRAALDDQFSKLRKIVAAGLIAIDTKPERRNN